MDWLPNNKCLQCGTAMVNTIEPYRYDESGLDGVTLENITCFWLLPDHPQRGVKPRTSQGAQRAGGVQDGEQQETTDLQQSGP